MLGTLPMPTTRAIRVLKPGPSLLSCVCVFVCVCVCVCVRERERERESERETERDRDRENLHPFLTSSVTNRNRKG